MEEAGKWRDTLARLIDLLFSREVFSAFVIAPAVTANVIPEPFSGE